MNPFDDEVVQEYLAECHEHLSGIESDLLSIEQDGAEIDEQRVNKVFRAAHSIKGGAGFFNFNKIRDLAHKTENVLDLIRSRRTVPTAEVVNVLLLAFDKLHDMIANPAESQQADISEFAGALEQLATSGLPQESRQSLTRQLHFAIPGRRGSVSATEFDVDAARKTGKSIYLAEYDLLHDVPLRDTSPRAILTKLMQYGSLLDTAFDLESAGTLEEEPSNTLGLLVLYATCVDTDLIGTVMDIPESRIWRVCRDGTCQALGQSPNCDECEEPEEQEAAAVEPRAGTPAEVEAEAARAPVETCRQGPARPAPSHPETAPGSGSAAAAAGDTTVRLNVGLLDSLMNLAGELVLCRNQLTDAVGRADQAMVQAASQSISAVTSEVQEAVMRTRLQPVGNLFQKYTRFVRDTGKKLGKRVRLVMDANEVELDKTIVEGLSDPLSHMVRNAMDHGIEAPQARAAQGKAAEGTVSLKAWHEAGLVVVEVADDGKGLDGEKLAASAVEKGLLSAEAAAAMSDEQKLNLIFLPGFSTAEKISDISGRGVGMDVVKTNLDRLGGKLEIATKLGNGSAFRIKLPLTLAIIPSLMVSAGEERVAIPLVNVQKLTRIAPDERQEKIQRVGDAELLMLEDSVLPLVDLAQALGIEAKTSDNSGAQPPEAMNVVLVSAGAFRYGLVVKGLHDTLEIVVKPLAQRLKHLQEYAGATILGDGCVALILDIAGLAKVAGLAPEGAQATEVASLAGDTHQLLLFHNSPTEACGLPLGVVARVEKVRAEQVETVGGRRSMQYRGRSLPLVTLADTAQAGELVLDSELVVVVLERGSREIGLLAARPVDVMEADIEIDPFTYRQTGVIGSAILRERTTLILDPFEIAEKSWPGWGDDSKPDQTTAPAGRPGAAILLAEDSTFFREQTLRLLEEAGYRVRTAADGQEAWEILARDAASFQLVITDVEMPRMDGLQLTRKIRADRRAASLPVLMLTSLAGEEDIKRGQAAGATAYCVKLDRDQLLGAIGDLLAGASQPALAELSRSLAGEGNTDRARCDLEIEGEGR